MSFFRDHAPFKNNRAAETAVDQQPYRRTPPYQNTSKLPCSCCYSLRRSVLEKRVLPEVSFLDHARTPKSTDSMVSFRPHPGRYRTQIW